MCKSKCFDAIAIVVSVLLGIGFALLVFFVALGGEALGPWLGLAFGLFVLFLLVLAATSLLRQDDKLNACICRGGLRVLIAALLLIVISAVAVIVGVANAIVGAIFYFLIVTLFVYILFALGCLISCIINSGCHHHHPCGCDK